MNDAALAGAVKPARQLRGAKAEVTKIYSKEVKASTVTRPGSTGQFVMGHAAAAKHKDEPKPA